MEGLSITQPIGSWYKRAEMEQKRWILIGWSGLYRSYPCSKQQPFPAAHRARTIRKEQMRFSSGISNTTEKRGTDTRTKVKRGHETTNGTTDFTIEDLQAGKHCKGSGAAAFFTQNSNANQKVQQHLNNYLMSNGTDRRVDNLRLPCGNLPIYTPYQTREYVRLVKIYQMRT